jgi:hypothetical protein
MKTRFSPVSGRTLCCFACPPSSSRWPARGVRRREQGALVVNPGDSPRRRTTPSLCMRRCFRPTAARRVAASTERGCLRSHARHGDAIDQARGAVAQRYRRVPTQRPISAPRCVCYQANGKAIRVLATMLTSKPTLEVLSWESARHVAAEVAPNEGPYHFRPSSREHFDATIADR